MVRPFITGIFGCFEYGIVCLFVAALSFLLVQTMETFAQSTYDYSAEQELLKAVNEGFESKQITSQQSAEILQFYRDEQAKRKIIRTSIFYAVSICISATASVFLFRKYRSLRFRERFREHFSQAHRT
jgi:uncharacterized membrane protein YcjF (UPF0283 family)